MKRKRLLTIDEIFADGKLIDAAMRKAAQEARRVHQIAGLPLVIWQNGKTVYLPPEKFGPPPRARRPRLSPRSRKPA